MTREARPIGPGADRVTCGALAVAATFGAMHAVVDAVSAAVLIHESGMAAAGQEAALYLYGASGWDLHLLYSGLAFGAQLPIGVLADRWRLYRVALPIALALLAIGLAVHRAVPLAAIVLVGIGNAGFHAGAGASVLRLVPRRASAIGVFVGPGALGLAAGIRLPHDYPGQWATIALTLLAIGLAGSLGLIAFSRRLGLRDEQPPVRDEECESCADALGKRVALACLAALMASIALRSMAGLVVGQIHRGEEALLWALAIAACGGKMLGGFVADRFGWLATSVVMLLLSMPLLSFCGGNGPAAVTGMALLQMTMPVTSIALYRVFPHEPGLAFGLASLALLMGAVFVFLRPAPWPQANLVLLALTLASIPAVVLGIRPLTAGRTEAM